MGDSTPTQQEQIKAEAEIKKAFPNIADALIGNKVVGFSDEQFAKLLNTQQEQLKKLGEDLGIAWKGGFEKLCETLKVPYAAPTAKASTEVADAPKVISKNKEAVDNAVNFIKSGKGYGQSYKLDKEEYLKAAGYELDHNGQIIGYRAEALTTPTQPINYNRTPIFIPGGQIPNQIRPFVQTKPTGQGNATVAWYTTTKATFGSITEGTAPSEDSVTFAQVTASPDTRGTYLKVKYSTLEDNAFDAISTLNGLALRASAVGESTEVLSTIADAATPNSWINGSTGATLSSNDDVASMTLTLTGVSTAKNVLDTQGYGDQAPYVFCVHPKNFNELVISSGITNFVQYGVPEIIRSGVMGQLLGVRLEQFNTVKAQDNTTNDTYRNIMMVGQQAFGLAVARDLTVKMEEHSELQQVYYTATHRIKGKELDNKAWVRVSCAQ